MDLTDTLRKREGKTLECKRNLSSKHGVLRMVVAFANTAGGTILIGFEAGIRYVRGVMRPLALEEQISSLVSDAISPRIHLDLELLGYRDTQVLPIQVYPSANRPHYLTRAGLEAGNYVRVGSTNRRAALGLNRPDTSDPLIRPLMRYCPTSIAGSTG